MTCLIKHLEDITCINCKRGDQVYLGHGVVRFCAHCSISWDPTEDGKYLDHQIKAVILSEDQDGELPEDMVERMGALIGGIVVVFAFEQRMANMMAIPEALFTEDQIKHLPGRHNQASHGCGGGNISGGPVPKGGLIQPLKKPQEQKAAEHIWRSLVATFSPVMRLVHEAMRMDSSDTKAMADELFKARKAEFNDAVSDYVSQLGCGGNGDLKTSTELKFFREDSDRDAENITNTYNLNLAEVIQKIRLASPHANRNIYSSRLRKWEASRKLWKSSQIALWTTMTARDQALKSFGFHNKIKPKVELMPKQAAEPICQGWINRGAVPFEVAVNNKSPYHLNCVHYWQPNFNGIEKDCADLWKG